MHARAKAAGTNAAATGLILSIFKVVKERLMGFVGKMVGVLPSIRPMDNAYVLVN